MSKADRRLLAEVQCSNLQFRPGDRILVKSYHRLSKSQRDQLRRTVERWAGDHVEVLVIDICDMEIEIERANERPAGIYRGPGTA